MTKQKNITQTPEPLERYAKQFDEIFSKSNQREAFRCYLEGLLLQSHLDAVAPQFTATKVGLE